MKPRDWRRRLEIEQAIARALEATANVIARRDQIQKEKTDAQPEQTQAGPRGV